MMDEHFTRQWNEVHEDFTADLHKALRRLGRYRRSRAIEPVDIGHAYADPPRGRREHGRTAGALHGLAAAILTAALFTAGVAVLTAGQPAVAQVPFVIA